MPKPRQPRAGRTTYHGLEYIQSKHPGKDTFAVGSGVNRLGVKNVRYPSVTLCQNGQPGVLFSACEAPTYDEAHRFVYFTRHNNESEVIAADLHAPYNTFIFGVRLFKGLLVAVYGGGPWGNVVDLVYRTSTDNGTTWTPESSLGLGFAQKFGSGIVADQCPAFWLTTNKAADTLYVFYLLDGTKQIWERHTSNSDLTGWTAGAYTGISMGQWQNFNMGDDTGEGMIPRAFIIEETKTPGVWAVMLNDGSGTVGENIAVWSGTLGGAWSHEISLGYGGGLLGGSGAIGGVFLDNSVDTIERFRYRLCAYAMGDQDNEFMAFRRDNDDLTWDAGSLEVVVPPNLIFGQGQGLYVPIYKKTMIWGHSLADGGLKCLTYGDGIPGVTYLGG